MSQKKIKLLRKAYMEKTGKSLNKAVFDSSGKRLVQQSQQRSLTKSYKDLRRKGIVIKT